MRVTCRGATLVVGERDWGGPTATNELRSFLGRAPGLWRIHLSALSGVRRARLCRGYGCSQARGYRPRDAEHTVLYQVIAEHLDAFLEAAAAGDGAGLPRSWSASSGSSCSAVCWRRGGACVACECALERLVPFSCCLQIDTMRSLAPRAFQ